MRRSNPNRWLPGLVSGIALTAAALIAPSPAEAASDGCRLYEHVNFLGDQYDIPLHDWDVSKVGSEQWGSNSERRSGDLLATQAMTGSVDYPGAWVDNFSSAKIYAGDTDITLYMYTGHYFDGEVVAWTCQKGQTCTLAHLQAFNDRVHSLICQREFPAQWWENQGFIPDVLEIPTKGIAEDAYYSTASRLSDLYWDDEIDLYGMPETSVTWTTTHSKCKTHDWRSEGLPCSTLPRELYKEELKIHQEFEIWPLDLVCEIHDVETDVYVRPVNFNGQFEFRTTGHWWIWVESGACAGWVVDLIDPILEDQFVRVDDEGRPMTTVADRANPQNFPWLKIEHDLTYGLHHDLGMQAAGEGLYNAGMTACMSSASLHGDAIAAYDPATGCAASGACCQYKVLADIYPIVMNLGRAFTNHRGRLQMTHTFSHDDQFVPQAGYPDVAGESPCITNVAERAYAPIIRLNKSRAWPGEVTMDVLGATPEIFTAAVDLEQSSNTLADIVPTPRDLDGVPELQDEQTAPPLDLPPSAIADLPVTEPIDPDEALTAASEDVDSCQDQLMQLHVPYLEELSASRLEPHEADIDDNSWAYAEGFEPTHDLDEVTAELEIVER